MSDDKLELCLEACIYDPSFWSGIMLMTSRRSFGVGCFHFGIKRKLPFKFKVSEYIEEVKLFLRAIPNVANIEIKNDDNESLIEVANPLHSLETDTFPLLNFLSMQFDISIPLQIQKELTETIFSFPLTTSMERFRGYIVHAFYSPVTFIEPIDMHDQNYDPSNSVIVVRESLASQSSKRQSGFLEFQALGPSPFHAEFLVEEPDSQDEEAPWFFWHEKWDMKGYDHITFYFDREQFEDIEEVQLFIMDEIKDEFVFSIA